MNFFGRLFLYFTLALMLGVLLAVAAFDQLYITAVAEEELMRTTGILRLVETFPVAERVAQLDSWQGQFGYLMQIIPVQETLLIDDVQLLLMAQGYWADVVSGWAADDVTVYYWLPDMQQTLVLTKQYQTQATHHMYSNGLFFMMLLVLALFLGRYVYQHKRHISQLLQTYSAYGNGDFNQRADVSMPQPYTQLACNFNQMAEQIASLLDEHKLMVNGVSHDLKSPLARLRFALDMTRGCDSVAGLRQFIEQMDNDLDDLSDLLDDWLLYAQINSNALQLNQKSCELESLVKNILANHSGAYPTLNVVFPNDKVSADVDKKLFSRVIENLLVNAFKFAQSQVVIEIRSNSGHFSLSVCDDGPGIGDEDKERVLQPFVRLDKSRTTQGGGLGLAIVKNLTERHQLKLNICDSEMGGACFMISGLLRANERGSGETTKIDN